MNELDPHIDITTDAHRIVVPGLYSNKQVTVIEKPLSGIQNPPRAERSLTLVERRILREQYRVGDRQKGGILDVSGYAQLSRRTLGMNRNEAHQE